MNFVEFLIVLSSHWITYLFLARLFFWPEKTIQKGPEKHFVDHLVLAKPFPRRWLITGGWMVLHWLVVKPIPCSSSVIVFHAFSKLLTTKRLENHLFNHVRHFKKNWCMNLLYECEIPSRELTVHIPPLEILNHHRLESAFREKGRNIFVASRVSFSLPANFPVNFLGGPGSQLELL